MFNHHVSISFSVNSTYSENKIPAIVLASALVKRAAEILAQELKAPSSTLETFELISDSYILPKAEAKKQDETFHY